jgi:hypothetical protein
MALDTPNDRALLNAVGHYDREIPGQPLTSTQLTRVAEAVKRFIVDEIHSAKAHANLRRG